MKNLGFLIETMLDGRVVAGSFVTDVFGWSECLSGVVVRPVASVKLYSRLPVVKAIFSND